MKQRASSPVFRHGGILLVAKQPGVTSFDSLSAVKRALGTKKVGHTGTLDSFAAGLLVVCVGSLTRLASYITQCDKDYDAVVVFGAETDTLDLTGTVVRQAPLPTEAQVRAAVAAHIGQLMQIPPVFSALHVSGKRASDVVRNGGIPYLAARAVTVSRADVQELLYTNDGTVRAARISWTVSKGTYIRSLARDIAAACGSAGYCAALRRTRVGNFLLSHAVGGAKLLENTSIDSLCTPPPVAVPPLERIAGDAAFEEIRAALQPMTESLAAACGLRCVHLEQSPVDDFLHGRPLQLSCFSEPVGDGECAVFSGQGQFLGLISCSDTGTISYRFVVNTL
ncbi:MAG: tRNA pseudouridine(55) synthase TruB [Treponema sp.]|nr:tRNA pseudouridine(55) synthase TruB [Treponema sp.]